MDVLAPTILPTTDITGSYGYRSGDLEPYFNGTSCATPYAAGVCALIISAAPTLTPLEVRDILVNTCTDVVGIEAPAPGWDMYAGYGLVNADLAVQTALIPTAQFIAWPVSGCEPLNVVFTDLSTGPVTGWSWDFGDGGTDMSPNPPHLYTQAGTYNGQPDGHRSRRQRHVDADRPGHRRSGAGAGLLRHADQRIRAPGRHLHRRQLRLARHLGLGLRRRPDGQRPVSGPHLRGAGTLPPFP